MDTDHPPSANGPLVDPALLISGAGEDHAMHSPPRDIQPLPVINNEPLSSLVPLPSHPPAPTLHPSIPQQPPHDQQLLGINDPMPSQAQYPQLPLPAQVQAEQVPSQNPRLAVPSAPHTPYPQPAPTPTAEQQQQSASDRTLNVTDALSYLDAVKVRFSEQPDVYNHFLDIMKDFKTSIIDTPGVIQRVSELFSGHSDLVEGFNTFLPPGYRIQSQDDRLLVITPSGVQSTIDRNSRVITSGVPRYHSAQSIQQTAPYHSELGGPSSFSSPAPQIPLPSVHHDSGMHDGRQPGPAMEFNRAIQFVNKIKMRFSNEPDTYREFLEVLQKFRQDGSGNKNTEVHQMVSNLFRNTPDLLLEFKEFLPEQGGGGFTLGNAAAAAESGHWTSGGHKRKEPSAPLVQPVPKRKKKVVKEEPAPKPAPPRQPKKTKYRPEPSPPYYENGHGASMSTPDDQLFFDRVKKALENRETYDEFLKLLNLFAQDIIDMRTLVEKAEYFLGDTGELFVMFRKLIGWDDRVVREPDPPNNAGTKIVLPYSLPPAKEDLHQMAGPSYRRLPANEAQVACSGRDELCRSVLNDEWVSHPTWASEDNSGFQAHKKNIYEEAMHRCEEERHEFDFHLEAMSKTISALENINMKIQQMTAEEKSTFKLKPGLGLPNKSIYQRIVRKVYGKDAGTEVITTLHDCPAVAVSIVLQRLKAKDEDWRRAQREWNKVWREVDARNFYKSLDHQGITFKVTDKKTLTVKALVSQIEIARDEQMSERAALLDPSANRTKPVHQLAYRLSDMAVIKDATKLTLAYLDRLPIYSHSEKEKIEKWLLEFLVLFFVLDKEAFEKGLAPGESNVPGLATFTAAAVVTPLEDEAENDGGKTPKSKGKQANGQGVHSGDLKKKLLNKGPKGSKPASRVASRASPSDANGMEVDQHPASVPAPVTEGEGGLTVDSVWIASQDSHKTPAFGTVLVSEPSPPIKLPLPAANRKTTFFTNTTFYVFLRAFQTLYSRLLLCKEIGIKLAEDPNGPQHANPVAYELGLTEGTVPGNLVRVPKPANDDPNATDKERNPAKYYYQYLLDACEKLFDAEIDQNTFEEQLRFMFGTKAYLLFTVDKVISALIKQIQTALAEPVSDSLLVHLQRERRQKEKHTSPQIISYRNTAADIIGPDEHVFRINWERGVMTMQLLGRNDPSTDDSETLADRWRNYIGSYVLTHPTEGVNKDVKEPFLRRTLLGPPLTDTGCHAHNGLEIKVCIRTFRLFFVSHTEDCFYRFSDRTRKEGMQKLQEVETKRKDQFDVWLAKQRAKLAAKET